MYVLQPTCRTPPPEKQQGHSAREDERGNTSGHPLQELKRLMKTVKPAHQKLWNQVDKDKETFFRLDAVAKKLEASQAEAKEHPSPATKQVEDQVSPRDACMSCNQPVEHHLLKSSRDTLQEKMKEAIHEVPVEPLKAPPKMVQPFPGDRTKFHLMPPLLPQSSSHSDSTGWPR